MANCKSTYRYDLSKEIKRHVISYVGNELVCQNNCAALCGRRFPDNVKTWDERSETQKVFPNSTFELVELFEHFLEPHHSLILLEKIQLGNNLHFKYNNIHIIYEPCTRRTGNVRFVGSRTITNTIFNSFMRLFRNSRANKMFRKFDIKREVRPYHIRKMLFVNTSGNPN